VAPAFRPGPIVTNQAVFREEGIHIFPIRRVQVKRVGISDNVCAADSRILRIEILIWKGRAEVPLHQSNHSCRSATIESTFVARRAGM